MTKLAHLKFNDPAPDLELPDTQGKLVRLSSLWKMQVLVLAFTRHFGCPQCKDMVDALSTAASEFKQKNLALAFVTQGTTEAAKVFCEERAPGQLCLSDPAREAYRAYGLERATIWQTFLSWRVWQSNKRLKEERGWNTDLPPAGQDAMQLAGTFVIGTDGRVRLPYYYDDIADHPPVDLLLHGVMGMDWNQPFEGPVAPHV
ncbi:MAG: AhpC/TSA family protein [Anaerolineales bacterium]|nr:AhpC/TSA family protein [Anaerolineales bacterium]